MSGFPYRSPEGRRLCLEWYDRRVASLTVPHEERDLDTRYGITHVVIAGPPEGQPLVLVHGTLGSAAQVVAHIAHFAEAGWRVFAPDVPGHSGKSEGRRLDDTDRSLGEWLRDTMDALGLVRASLVGFSLGGLVVLRLGEIDAERIARAVLCAPAGLSQPTVLRAAPMVASLLMYRMTGNAKWRRRMALCLFGPKATPDPDLFEGLELAIAHVDIEARPHPVLSAGELSPLTAPILVLAGQDDLLFDCRGTLVGASMLRDSTVDRIEGCGHFLDLASQTWVQARVDAFLRA